MQNTSWINIIEKYYSKIYLTSSLDLIDDLVNEDDLYNISIQLKAQKNDEKIVKKEETVPDIEDYKPTLMNKPEPPRYPTPDECCGNGCRICVYDEYEQSLRIYEDELKKWEKYTKK